MIMQLHLKMALGLMCLGKITKGYYHGDIPVIEIEAISETSKPKDALVYPPDDFYIPTSSLLFGSLY